MTFSYRTGVCVGREGGEGGGGGGGGESARGRRDWGKGKRTGGASVENATSNPSPPGT